MKHLKRFVAPALIVASLTSSPALAADIPVKAPRVVAPAPDWVGFYVGAHGGYLWSHTRFTATFTGIPVPLPNDTIDLRGSFGGGQIGFDYRLSPNWVAGIVADASASGAKGSTVIDPASLFPSVLTSDIKWMATVRARFGYDARVAFLYATAGAAFAHVKAQDTNIGFGFNVGAGAHTFHGLAAGAGAEFFVTQRVRLMVEYLHIELAEGSITFAPAPLVGTNNGRIDLVKGGLNIKVN